MCRSLVMGLILALYKHSDSSFCFSFRVRRFCRPSSSIDLPQFSCSTAMDSLQLDTLLHFFCHSSMFSRCSFDSTAACRCTLLLWKGPWADKLSFPLCGLVLQSYICYDILWKILEWSYPTPGTSTVAPCTFEQGNWVVVPLDLCLQQS